MNECECTLAGFCTRHNIKKATRMVELCQTDEAYWEAWEAGVGPGQIVGSGKRLQPVSQKATKSAWHVIHTRYASAIASGHWNESEEFKWLNFVFVRMIPCGACGSKWANLSKAIDLKTAENAFESLWKAHNTVSTEHVSPQNRTISYDQCRAIYLGEKVNRNCVVTLATGPAVHIHNVSRNSIMRYAERCGADYIELKGTTEDWWGLEKFRVRNIAKAYNRTLFLDCDLIIKPDCPDLFQLVPEDCVGMHDDYSHLRKVEWLSAERMSVFKSQDVAGDYSPTTFNTGVVVCSRMQADIWERPKDPFPTSHCAEQIWIEYLARQFKIAPLPTAFNVQWWMQDFEKLKADAHIVHWANCKNKVKEMSQFLVA